MSICNALTNNVQSAKCRVSGGLKARAWVFQLADFTGANTYSASGALSTFALTPGAKAITATSRPKKGSGTNKLAKTEEGAVSVEQALTLEFSYNDQTELDTIGAFLRVDGKTVFVETNAGTIRQYFAEYGDVGLDGDEGTGTLIGDASNVLKATLKGTEGSIARFFEAPITGSLTQLAASRAYLDNLVAVGGVATAPGTPGGVRATTSDSTATLTWNAAAPNGSPVLSYTVRYRPLGATTYSVFGTTANLTAAVTGLSNGQAYELTVSATNAVGAGAPSVPLTATPTALDRHLVLLLGNSLLHGQGATAGKEPDKLLALSLGSSHDVVNYAVPGARSDEYLSLAQSQPGGFYPIDHSRYASVTCLISADVNGQAGYQLSAPLTPAESLENLRQLHALAQANGCQTIQLTDSACGRSYGTASEDSIEAGTQALAVLLRGALSSSLHTQCIVDLKLTALGVHLKGSAVAGLFDSDNQHYTDAGYAIQNQELTAAVRASQAGQSYGQAVVGAPGDNSALPALSYSLAPATFANVKGAGYNQNTLQYTNGYAPRASAIGALAIGANGAGAFVGSIRLTVRPTNGEFWIGLSEQFVVSDEHAILHGLHYRGDVGCRIFGTYSGNENGAGVYTNVLPNSTGPLVVDIESTGTAILYYVNNVQVFKLPFRATKSLLLAAVLGGPGAKVEDIQLGGEHLVPTDGVFINPAGLRRRWRQALDYDATTGRWGDQATKSLAQRDYAVATSATGVKPSVLPAALNGYDVLRFESTANYGDGLCSLRTLNSVGLAGNQGWQVHIVFRVPSGHETYLFGLGLPVAYDGNPNTGGSGDKTAYADGWLYGGQFASMPTNTGVSVPATTWVNAAIRFDGTNVQVQANGQFSAAVAMNIPNMLDALLTLGAGHEYMNFNGFTLDIADYALSDDSDGAAGWQARYNANGAYYNLT